MTRFDKQKYCIIADGESIPLNQFDGYCWDNDANQLEIYRIDEDSIFVVLRENEKGLLQELGDYYDELN